MTKPILELSGTAAVLVFDLSPGSSGKYDFDRAVNVQKLCNVLSDYKDWLRQMTEHGYEEKPEWEDGITEAKRAFLELINEEGIGELFL